MYKNFKIKTKYGKMTQMNNIKSLMACMRPTDAIELENDELVKPETEKKTQYWKWSILFSL